MANDDNIIITSVAQWLDRWMNERDVPGSIPGEVVSDLCGDFLVISKKSPRIHQPTFSTQFSVAAGP